ISRVVRWDEYEDAGIHGVRAEVKPGAEDAFAVDGRGRSGVGGGVFAGDSDEGGAGVWDQFRLKAPVFGPIFRKLAISRFARTLGTLIANGVPILQALNIVKETTGNVVVSG